MQKSYCEMTKYPEFFREVYWGAFKCNEEDGYMKPIFENRNRFIENFITIKKNIYRAVKCKQQDFFELVFERLELDGVHTDHLEYYDTGYSLIGISSHYCSELDHATWQKYGFRLIDPLYAPDQSTYMYEYFYKSLAVEKQLKESREMKLMCEALNSKKLIRK